MANKEEIEDFLNRQTAELIAFMGNPGMLNLGERVNTCQIFVRTLHGVTVLKKEHDITHSKGAFLYTGDKPTEEEWQMILATAKGRKDFEPLIPKLLAMKAQGRIRQRIAHFQKRFNALLEEAGLPWRMTTGTDDDKYHFVMNKLK